MSGMGLYLYLVVTKAIAPVEVWSPLVALRAQMEGLARNAADLDVAATRCRTKAGYVMYGVRPLVVNEVSRQRGREFPGRLAQASTPSQRSIQE